MSYLMIHIFNYISKVEEDLFNEIIKSFLLIPLFLFIKSYKLINVSFNALLCGILHIFLIQPHIVALKSWLLHIGYVLIHVYLKMETGYEYPCYTGLNPDTFYQSPLTNLLF